MSFNIYEEAKGYFEELLDNYKGSNKASVTLEELVYNDEHRTEYNYSVYTAALFKAIADDLNILGFAEEVEEEFGAGIANNPMWINEAIRKYILDQYGNDTASYFDIEAEDEEEDEDE